QFMVALPVYDIGCASVELPVERSSLAAILTAGLPEQIVDGRLLFWLGPMGQQLLAGHLEGYWSFELSQRQAQPQGQQLRLKAYLLVIDLVGTAGRLVVERLGCRVVSLAEGQLGASIEVIA